MNMKTAYKVYLFCCVLFLAGLFLLAPVYAVEDMWTAATRVIKDIYTHIASVSTVLAGLMTAIAVVGAKLSNTQQKSDQAWDWLKRIWLAWAIINGIGAFIAYALNTHILPRIGGYRLRDISPMQIQALMAGLSRKSYSLQSKVLVLLRNIFCVAQENGLIAKSPISSTLKAGGVKTKEKVALTPQESARLLAGIKNKRAKTFALIALDTGMRRGEILALRWANVDFERKVIHVCSNALVKEGRTDVNADLKTSAAKRDIPLSEELEQWLAQQKPLAHSQFVIAMENHQPLTKSSFRSMWRLIERELPGTHLTAHVLRHTHITRLFEAGLDIKEVQYLAGHSTVDMTLRVYTHYDRKSREAQTAEKVRAAFKRVSA